MRKLLLLNLLFVLAFAALAQKGNTGTGLTFNDDAYQASPMKATLVRSMYGSSLPSSASLKAYAPIPKSQGSYGTCVGWSSAYCAFTIVQAQKNGWTDKTAITDNAYSPGFIYNQIKSATDINCAWGAYINDALEIMKTKGIVKYSDMDMSCPASLDHFLFQKASNNTIQDYARLFNTGDPSNLKIQTTKKSLSEGKPVVIGMKCPDSFYDATDCWTPTESALGSYGGHAMCVVGYDDNMHGGAFEIQNSWGETWGNSGYIWIKYADYAEWVKYGFELIDNLKPINNVTEASFSGSVRYQLSTGEDMDANLDRYLYRMKKAYKSGTKFRLYITNNEPAFVYAFGTDATSQIFRIFPHEISVSPALTYSSNEVAIPDEDHYIEMDNTAGKDYLCVLYSLEPLDIETIMANAKRATGSFAEKVQSAVGDKMIPYNDVSYYFSSMIGFEAKSTTKTVVALIVEIEHLP